MKKKILAVILIIPISIKSSETFFDWNLNPDQFQHESAINSAKNISELNKALSGLKNKNLETVDKLLEYIKNNISNIQKIPQGRPVTKDYREDRIRIFYNSDNLITGISIG